MTQRMFEKDDSINVFRGATIALADGKDITILDSISRFTNNVYNLSPGLTVLRHQNRVQRFLWRTRWLELMVEGARKIPERWKARKSTSAVVITTKAASTRSACVTTFKGVEFSREQLNQFFQH